MLLNPCWHAFVLNICVSLVIPSVLSWSIGEDLSCGNLGLGLVMKCSKGVWSRGAKEGLQNAFETLQDSIECFNERRKELRIWVEHHSYG